LIPSVFLLVSLLPTVDAEVMTRLSRTVQERCATCHDTAHTLDLTALPPASDGNTWMKILRAVESSRMPPPARTGPIERRFPLDPGVRAQLIADVSRLLGAALDPPVRTNPISFEVWTSIMEGFTKDVLPRGALKPLLEGGGDVGTPAEPSFAANQSVLDERAERLCAAVIQAELQAPAKRQVLLHGLFPSHDIARLSDGELDRVIGSFLSRLYGMPVGPRQVQAARQTLRKIRASSESSRDALVGFCVSSIAGPELIYILDAENQRP
jgi:hypothetical protein